MRRVLVFLLFVSALSAADRLCTFREVELRLDSDAAVAEAKRCLACGCGPGCGLCQRVCIYAAIGTGEEGYDVDPDKCDGCGLCTFRCRNQNITMVPKET